MRRVLYILGELADEDLDWLLAAGSRQSIAPGQVLIREGTSPDSLFLIADGEVRVLVSQPKPREVARLGQGEILGELSFIDSRPASATAEAATKTIVLRIPRAAVQVKLQSDPRFASRFYRALAVFLSHRLRQTTARMGYGDAKGDEDDSADELSPEVLDQLALAGKRSEWIIGKLLGR